MTDFAESNIESLSDEDFLNSPVPDSSTHTDESVEEPEGTETDSDDVTEEMSDDADGDDNDDIDADESDDTDDIEEADESDEDTDTTDTTDDGETAESEVDIGDVDVEQEYKKLLAPFKASGRDMQVRNVDEAIRLMQMGADYQKKMANLKPGLKTLKLLQNHDLLEPEKVSLMIDAAKGDKAAISQLIKNSGIDPLDLDVEAEENYQPKAYSVDDRELVFDDVVDRIKDTPTYRETINLVGKDWDDSSRQIVADNPHLLEVINSHMANGIYALVSKEVERERLMGRLNGLSDIAAYRQVGEMLDSRGAFKGLTGSTQAKDPIRKVVSKGKQQSDKSDMKKRAGIPSRKQAAKVDTLEDVLDISDEEFLKRFG